MKQSEVILILDYGAQYSQLIARRVRELGVYSELHPYTISIERIRELQPRGIILSGSPYSTYEKDAPISTPDIFNAGIPILGICYGLQLIAYQLGGEVDPAARREFGSADLIIDDSADLFAGIADNGQHSTRVWMSHGDHITKAPPGFVPIAHSVNAPICAIRDAERKIFGVQFHPEVVHTEHGAEMLRRFAFDVCGCRGDWTMASFVDESIARIRETVGDGRVVCGLSGGVDSTVAAVLLHRALGDRLTCIFVDNGLLRQDEAAQVRARFERLRERMPDTPIIGTMEGGYVPGRLAKGVAAHVLALG